MKNEKQYEIIIKKDGETVVNEKTNCMLVAFRAGEQAVQSIACIENSTTEAVASVIAGVKKQINALYNKNPEIKDRVFIIELLKMLKEGGEE